MSIDATMSTSAVIANLLCRKCGALWLWTEDAPRRCSQCDTGIHGLGFSVANAEKPAPVPKDESGQPTGEP